MILFLNSVHDSFTFKVRKSTLEVIKVVNNGLVGPVYDTLSSSIVEAKYISFINYLNFLSQVQFTNVLLLLKE